MRKVPRIFGAVFGVTLLVAAVSACDAMDTDGAASSATPAATSSAPVTTDGPAVPEPSTDDGAWTGPGEDPATMEDDVSQIDPDGYETLPGNCINDVPLPDSKHGVIKIEDLPGDECHITIDSQGDSLYMVNDISQQLAALGFELTSGPSDDSSQDAVNTVSYVTGTHEVHVTVTQDGVSGVIIDYVLADPTRGNG